VRIVAGVMQDRSAIAARMRLEGHTYESIGKALGVSRQRAHQMAGDLHAPTRLRLPVQLVERLRQQYERSCARRRDTPSDDGFRAWLSTQIARALGA
jgi:hypothetical protein